MRLLRLKTVLIAIDLDETGSGALRTAEMVAEAAGAALHVVHVSNSGDESGTVTELHATLRRTGLAIDEAATHVVAGEPSHAINLLADRIGADVIVLGPHRRRDATGLGSTALAVVTNAAVPCLVARSLLRLPLQRTVVAVDLSDTARGALVVALSWASALRARHPGAETATTLTALRVHPSARSTEAESVGSGELDEQLNRVRKEAGVWAGIDVEGAATINESPATGIAEYAREHRADLVVLGTRGLGVDAIGRLGSVSAAVMQRLDVPALLVPPAVWTAHASSQAK
ncbi:MAG TPA: universal stress protein [Gemmatimonadaceae bacterium]|jgi:nucleotide-binding universal stress UspA family protein|nr:universal stress protein [Gemmatimonadaceae bacterium]